MSKKNGDKARFSREQKKKLLRRKRNLALRQSLAKPSVTQIQATSDPQATAPNSGAADAIL
ncbi:MAG TPA: hypothetical protein VFZ34_32615 [Blastocatellia bacterium]|nr:hypothetical protein [Blastocatellia bacterium]